MKTIVKVLAVCVLTAMLSGCAEEMKCDREHMHPGLEEVHARPMHEEHVERTVEYKDREPLVVRCSSDEIVKILYEHQDGNCYLIDVRSGEIKKVGDAGTVDRRDRVVSESEVIINKSSRQ